MPIKYKAVSQAQPGVKGGGSYSYYARICDRENMSIYELCDQISDMSTFSRGDVIGVVETLLDIIPTQLKRGKNISLGNFGTFSLSISSEAVETANQLTSRNIKKTNIQFRPGVMFKKEVSMAKFIKVK